MAIKTVSTITCDGCGKEKPQDYPDSASQWLVMYLGGHPQNRGDLCPACHEAVTKLLKK